ncbi:hypothetical protein PRUPE_2G150100 [Prunus persica]|uniref:Uncharacterized protein n=1 Tax=Prunus persica TaxID=3760 RepID=A0A251QG73_PRUPE|nr:hypothetical protein PRUPE_2G150100 [Prunus persica]
MEEIKLMNFEKFCFLPLLVLNILWPYNFDNFFIASVAFLFLRRGVRVVTFITVILRGLTILVCHILRTRQFLGIILPKEDSDNDKAAIGED